MENFEKFEKIDRGFFIEEEVCFYYCVLLSYGIKEEFLVCFRSFKLGVIS